MKTGFFILMVAVSIITGCVTGSDGDTIVANSLGDLGERPKWTIDGMFKKYVKEEVSEEEKKTKLLKSGRFTTKNRRDLDLCYKNARDNTAVGIRQTIGEAISSLAEQAVESGDITTGESKRVQSLSQVTKVQGMLAGVEVEEKFWQQIKLAGGKDSEYECYVLVSMPKSVFTKQLEKTIRKMEGVSTETQEKLKERASEVDEVLRNQDKF